MIEKRLNQELVYNLMLAKWVRPWKAHLARSGDIMLSFPVKLTHLNGLRIYENERPVGY